MRLEPIVQPSVRRTSVSNGRDRAIGPPSALLTLLIPHPRKPKTSKIKSPVVAKSIDANGWRPFKRATLLVLLTVLGMIVLGGATEPTFLPGALSGVWQTSSDTYAKCYMEFSPISIIFGTVDGGSTLYFVTRVEETKESGETTYLIQYTDLANVRYEMALRYRPGPNAVLYLKNQPKVIWIKRRSA